MVQVSLSTSTNYSGEQNALVEEKGNALTVNFSLDEPAPSGGLKVYVDSDVEQIVNRLNLPGFGANPIVENINPSLLGTNFDNSGFFLTIDEGATSASFTIDVFDNSEPDTFLPETFDGLVEAVFQLKTQDQVDSQDLGDVGNLSDYTIDSNAATSSVLFADSESQLTEQPPEPTPEPTPGTGLPLVSLNTGPDYLVEADGTVSAHVFNVTGGTIPEGGIVVGVNAPNLSEFNLDAIDLSDGGEIVNVREDGFDIRLMDFTTLVNLPVAADGEAEGLETASFSLVAGDGYEVNEDFGSGEFTIADTAEEVPNNFSEPNDIIPLAQDIGLSADNPQVTITETLDFEIDNRYQNKDGSFNYVDASEDVDFYKVDLQADDIVSFDIDSIVEDDITIANFEFAQTNGVVSILRLFDAEGNELAVNQEGQAPGELYIGGTDPYLEFKAPESGTYYLGTSVIFNGTPFRFGEPEFAGTGYDPYEPASGNGFSFANPEYLNFGEYELNVNLNPDNLVILAEQLDSSNNSPPDTVDLAQPGEPVVSLKYTGVTLDALNEDALINNTLVEGYIREGSILVLALETEGNIPEEGIEVTVNSDIYLRDYFAATSLGFAPFTPGAELIDVVTDDTGRETGLKLRLFEPNTFFPLNLRTQNRGELLEPGTDGLEFQPENDGPEQPTFFLEAGQGYGINPDASQINPTFYDSVEQAGEPTVIPEVSLTINETELVESEGTETTLTFRLSEPPSDEGVVVYVDNEIPGFLSQFDPLNAEISGGVFPLGNFDSSGFYFRITDQVASITLPVFADPFEEGRQTFTFALQESPIYTIDNDAGEVVFTISDTPSDLLEVGLSTESIAFVESEDATGVLTLNLTATPPSEGVTVTVEAPNLAEFDTDAISVTGGEITEITDTGFTINVTDITAVLDLPVISDGEVEGLENAEFSLVEGTNYLINPDASEAIIAIADIPEQAPAPASEFKPNDTISEAIDLNLNPENPNATISGSIRRSEPGKGFAENIDFSEDVDFYTFNLETGDTVKIDVDSIPFEVTRFEGVEQRLDSELRLFDSEGNELASVNNGAAPDEELSRDPYLEFTAKEAGSYYVGVSQLGNDDYDPNVESSGSGWIFPEIGVFSGKYDLNIELASDSDGLLPTTEPIFGSLEADIIEVSGTSQIVFGGDSDDLIDASIGSEGNNRIYAGSGDDSLILGSGDRLIGGEGADKFFATSGGDNILTGGEGADQFWIATAEISSSANIITDFTSGEDVLGIAGLGIGFDDLSITGQEDNTLIAANGSDLAILQGIGADSLIADSFAFA